MPDSPRAISGGGILSANSLFPRGARFRRSLARAAHNLNQGDVKVTRGIFAWLLVLTLCVGGLPDGAGAVLAQSGAPAASPDYTVGARDILVISVWKQSDLSGKFQTQRRTRARDRILQARPTSKLEFLVRTAEVSFALALRQLRVSQRTSMGKSR